MILVEKAKLFILILDLLLCGMSFRYLGKGDNIVFQCLCCIFEGYFFRFVF